MKNLIKELAKREGKKSQVKIGDLRETVSKLQEMIAEELASHIAVHSAGGEDPYAVDFLSGVGKKFDKILKKKKINYYAKKVTFNVFLGVPEKSAQAIKKAK